MKQIPLVLLSVALTSLGRTAELASEPNQTQAQVRRQLRVGPPVNSPGQERLPEGPFHPPGKREKISYLGVAVSPASPSLAAQLQLAPRTGLVVAGVASDSPARDAIKLHDVLVELDGQLLINPEQLAVLVHNHRAGEELTLKLIRSGKPEAIKVKLSEREVNVGQRGPLPQHPMPPRPGVHFPGGVPAPGPAEVMERPPELDRRGTRAPNSFVRQRRLVVRDESGSIELEFGEKERHVTVKGQNGETIFAGPLNSPEERQALPEAIRRRLQRIPEARALFSPEERN